MTLVSTDMVDSDGRMAPDAGEQYVIVIPKEEWDAHKQRVEAMVNLINGVINGMASNPMLMSILPPDVIRQMQGKV